MKIYLISALVGAVIGYITNWLAIKMLFKPHNEKRVFGIRIPFTPGLIPKEKKRIAKSIGETVSEHILTNEVIAQSLNNYPETRIQVNGYTDSTGNDAHNQELSQRRANSVAQYLISQGVSSSRIVANGFGSSNPIASNATPEGRQANRRVEVRILPAQ